MTTPITSFLSSLGSPPDGGNQVSAPLPVDEVDFPDGPIVRFVLYHPSLFKVEHDFPNVICVQDVPRNRFFSANAVGGLGTPIHPVPDFVSGWRELILIPIIRKSLYKIFTVLRVPDSDAKIAMIIGVMGQGATFRNQDLVLSRNDFHRSRQYYRATRFKKTLAMMNFSTEADATLNVYIHLENEAYTLFDGILMNPHISPYTARTNSALTKAVDQLIQQTVFSPVTHSLSTVPPSSALGILSSGSRHAASVVPPDRQACLNVDTTLTPAPAPHALPTSAPASLLPLHSPAPIPIGNVNSSTVAHANVDHVTPQAISQPQVTSPPPRLQVTSPPRASPGSTTYTFQTCTANQHDTDPTWDAFAGSRCFRQSPTNPVAVHALRAQRRASSPPTSPLILAGATWTSYHVNPNEDYPFHERTQNIPSWYGVHPTFGRCENFPVSLAHTIVDKELFLACCRTTWDRKHYNHFVSQFPQFTHEVVTPRNLIEYYHRIVDYARPRGVFVPPLSTLRPGLSFGIWFTELLVHIQHEVETIFTGLLSTCLNHRLTGSLAKHRVLAGIISNTSDGYEALLLMAQYAGHPLLNVSTSTLREPRQRKDQMVQEYINDWIYYLYHQSLSGIFLSDRYFVQQFVTGLDPDIQFCLGDSFENLAAQHPRHEALPSSFYPLQLSMTLRDRALRLNCLRLLELSPREFYKNSATSTLRQVVSDDNHGATVDVISAVATSELPSTRHCLMCNSTVHLFNACPKVSDLSPDTRRIVFSGLLKARDSACPHSGSGSRQIFPSRNQSQVRAIMTDITPVSDVTSEATPLDLDASDCLPDDNIDMHPDFQ